MTIFRVGRPCTVVVCRGCCCGSARKFPDTDHEAQLHRLREAAAGSDGSLVIRTTDCLGACERANVLVVQPSTRGRTRGGRTEWLGWALDQDCIEDVVAYTLAGGPGLTPCPATLELHRAPAPRDPGPRR
ncbi:(2Fe-2S) ferredoxin domain-containing protein [Peterkaempfera sp. SMS 1(5)a]|uniref:(2Fe-2S) ferredoxin domain-containing protein n=1 Tax=Peterkaempfera podocarpi TaxID=3232308 RepID=UPI00366CF6B2